MRTVISCRTLWTLHREDHTRSAEIREVAAGGPELRFMQDGTLTVWHLFRDGADLLREAAVERFELEAPGWADMPASTVARRGVRWS
jgi:hypothetical protein